MKITRQIIVFDTADLATESAFWAGILGGTRYWTPEIHVGAFNLPPYIAEHLPMVTSGS